ncbi:MAG: carbon-nitrogen hydrolase family protein [Solirubrobacteraceae bacterium]
MTDQSIQPLEEKAPLLAAAVQLNSTDDVARNRAIAERLVREAAGRGAQLVVLPEKWNLLAQPERMLEAAEPLDGPSTTWACELARELRIDLVAGSIVERAEGRDKGFNTSVHAGPDGEPRAVYRKLHLFDVEVAGTVYRESETEEPGEDIAVSRTAAGAGLGLSVCYDLRFPELYRILAVRGARILTVPSAFTLATTREHWEVLLRARAIENQAFVVAANQVGVHPPGHRCGGRSMIVDPWGVVLAQAPDREAAIVVELDLAAQDEVRAKLPSLANRRPEAYRWPEEVPA